MMILKVIAVLIAMVLPSFAQGPEGTCYGCFSLTVTCNKDSCLREYMTMAGEEIDASPWVFAQATSPPIPISPTDQEITEAYALCNKPENRVGIGSVGNRPSGAGGYELEIKDKCSKVDAEYQRRDIAAKAKKVDDLKRLDSLIGRMSK
jgi:hypothetical protein